MGKPLLCVHSTTLACLTDGWGCKQINTWTRENLNGSLTRGLAKFYSALYFGENEVHSHTATTPAFDTIFYEALALNSPRGI